MTDYETEIICLECESNPCLCLEKLEFPELEPIGCEPPCMTEPDFYNCENCGAEIEMGSSCYACESKDVDVDDFEEPIEEEKDQNYYYS